MLLTWCKPGLQCTESFTNLFPACSLANHTEKFALQVLQVGIKSSKNAHREQDIFHDAVSGGLFPQLLPAHPSPSNIPLRTSITSIEDVVATPAYDPTMCSLLGH